MQNLTLAELQEINRALSNRMQTLSYRLNKATTDKLRDQIESELEITINTKYKVHSMLEDAKREEEHWQQIVVDPLVDKEEE